MASVEYNVKRTRTTTVIIEEDEAARIIRKAIKAPNDASVAFNCNYESLHDIRVSWTEEAEPTDD